MQSRPHKHQRNNRRQNHNNNRQNNRNKKHSHGRNTKKEYKIKGTIFLNLVAIICLILSLQFSWIIWVVWICCINVIAFRDTIIDKNIAQLSEDAPKHEKTRIPEHRFCTQALLSGWIGLIIAQQISRHKTRKTSFKVKMYFCILVNISLYGAFIYIFLHPLN